MASTGAEGERGGKGELTAAHVVHGLVARGIVVDLLQDRVEYEEQSGHGQHGDAATHGPGRPWGFAVEKIVADCTNRQLGDRAHCHPSVEGESLVGCTRLVGEANVLGAAAEEDLVQQRKRQRPAEKVAGLGDAVGRSIAMVGVVERAAEIESRGGIHSGDACVVRVGSTAVLVAALDKIGAQERDPRGIELRARITRGDGTHGTARAQGAWAWEKDSVRERCLGEGKGAGQTGEPSGEDP